MSNEPEKTDRFVVVRKAPWMRRIPGKHYVRRAPRTSSEGQRKARFWFARVAGRMAGSKATGKAHPVREAVRRECQGPFAKEEKRRRILSAAQYYNLQCEMERKGIDEVLLPEGVGLPTAPVPSKPPEHPPRTSEAPPVA